MQVSLRTFCNRSSDWYLKELGERGAGGAKIGVALHAVAQPAGDLAQLLLAAEALISQNDGAVVVPVPDDAPQRLVHRPARRSRCWLIGVHCTAR